MGKITIGDLVNGTIESISNIPTKNRVLLQNYHFSDFHEFLIQFRKKIAKKYNIKEINYVTDSFYNNMSDFQLDHRLTYEEKHRKNRVTLILDPFSRLDEDFISSRKVYYINFGQCRGY